MKYFKFALHKSYFEKGYSLSHYFFKIIAIFGLTTQDLKNTMLMIAAYSILIYVLGWVWYRFGFVLAEAEVANQYNLFQQEMRKVYKV